MTTVELQNEASLGDIMALLKPRVMSLAVFTAVIGMFVAPGVVHPVIGLASVLFIAVGAGASGALNMWWDADIDAVMTRTHMRPVPAGRIAAGDAMQIGMWLSGLAVVMLALTANMLAAGLLAFSIFFYVVIYTMLLKRSTVHNIVIGGAAGALPPVIGWAVVTGEISYEAILMFMLIFLWTPPHFWALALFTGKDYHHADVPMMTVRHGEGVTRRHILVYSLTLLPVCGLLTFSSVGGPVTAMVSLAVNFAMVKGALALSVRDEIRAGGDRYAAERLFFRQTLTYLFAIFTGLAIDAMLRMHLADVLAWPVIF